MEKVRVVLVEFDENYIFPIEFMLAKELEDKVEIYVITDSNYFEEFKKNPIKADMLVISDRYYTKELEKHNIKSILVLNEIENNVDFTANLSLRTIYKYKTAKEICREIMSDRFFDGKDKSSAKIITVYSPMGGVGKTVTAMGLSLGLAKINKKVLYISTETVQSFSFAEDKVCNREFIDLLLEKNEGICDMLEKYIENQRFDYIPPIYEVTPSIDINVESYIFLIEKLKTKGNYDYVIVDTSVEFTSEKSKILGKSDKVIIITEQDKEFAMKLNKFNVNVDCSNKDKFIFICNKYDKYRRNYLVEEKYSEEIIISEYIERFELDEVTIEELEKKNYYNNIIYRLS